MIRSALKFHTALALSFKKPQSDAMKIENFELALNRDCSVRSDEADAPRNYYLGGEELKVCLLQLRAVKPVMTLRVQLTSS